VLAFEFSAHGRLIRLHGVSLALLKRTYLMSNQEVDPNFRKIQRIILVHVFRSSSSDEEAHRQRTQGAFPRSKQSQAMSACFTTPDQITRC